MSGESNLPAEEEDSTATDIRVCRDMIGSLRSRRWFPLFSSIVSAMAVAVVLYSPIAIFTMVAAGQKDPRMLAEVGGMIIFVGFLWVLFCGGIQLCTPTATLPTRIEAFIISHKAMEGKQYDETLAALVKDFGNAW
jgi:hypothetical protein